MPLLLRFALRNLLRHRWRTLATVVGVGLGIAAVLATLSVGANVEANIDRTLEAASGRADLLVTPGAGGRAVFDPADALPIIGETSGVAVVRQVLHVRAEPVRDVQAFEASVIPGVDSGFQLAGREVAAPEDLPTELAGGRYPRPASREIALAQPFAVARGIELGDRLAFASRFGEIAFEVTGLLDGAVGYASTNGSRVAIAPLEVLQDDMRLPDRVSFLEVRVADEALAGEVRSALESRLGERYAVNFPAGSGDAATGIVDTLQSGLLVLAVTLMALGGFMAYNTFTASVVERTREYALLRTVCMRRRDVERLALLEAALVSALGTLVGVALGIALAYGITRLNAVVLGFEFRTLVIPVGVVAAAAVVGAAVSLLAGYLPARLASQTPPLAALRRASGSLTQRSARRSALGWSAVALGTATALLPWSGLWALAGSGVAMALFFFGVTLATPDLLRPALALLGPPLRRVFGVAGRLGANFTERSAERNGVAIGTVIVGTGLIVGVGAMVSGINAAISSWVETTVVGDLFVTSPVSFPEDFETTAAAIEGVNVVSGVALRVVRFEAPDQPRGRSVALILVDPERFDPESGFGRFQYIQGQGDDRSGHAALEARGEVLAASTLRERFGIGAGDTVRLRTSDGFAQFEVGAVVVDFTGGGEAFVGSIGEIDRFGGGSPDLYVFTVDEGAEPSAVRDRLLTALPELYLDVTLNDTYQQRILTLSNRSFATTNALLVLAVLIAALGVANTLGMNLTSRQHEIAVLRTLGLPRSGVRRMIVAEGIVILTVGTILGILVGLLLGRVVTTGAAALTGYVIDPVYPWRLIVLALALSPVVGLVASLLPARRAAKLAPMVAMRGSE